MPELSECSSSWLHRRIHPLHILHFTELKGLLLGNLLKRAPFSGGLHWRGRASVRSREFSALCLLSNLTDIRFSPSSSNTGIYTGVMAINCANLESHMHQLQPRNIISGLWAPSAKFLCSFDTARAPCFKHHVLVKTLIRTFYSWRLKVYPGTGAALHIYRMINRSVCNAYHTPWLIL